MNEKTHSIKKIIIIATVLIFSIWLINPIIAQALTAEELQAQINILLAQISQLQAQLTGLKGQQTVSNIPSVCQGISFNRNLRQGMLGSDVKCLQALLNQSSDTKIALSGIGSPGNETTYFGSLTKAAVIRFQEKYTNEILAPWSLITGNGFVGSTTLAKVNELYYKAPPQAPDETAKTSPCGSYGDVNLDGLITSTDSDLVLNYVTGTQTLTQEQLRRADVNNDGSVTSADAMFILQYFEGKIATFEICKTPKPPCNSYGDVDKDSYITKTDSNLVLNYVVGTQTLTPEQKTRADVDGDGDVDSVDAMFILQYVEGVRDTFPVCSKTPPSEVEIGTAYGPEYNIAPEPTEERMGITAIEVTLEPELQTLLELINDYRASYSLRTLLVSPDLTTAAQWMSEDMATNDYFSHTDSLGRDPFERMADFGYNHNTWRGENLAAGCNTPEMCLQLWKDSPGHNANQLNPNFVVIGLGKAYDGNSAYGWYWAAEFGGYNDTGLELGDADCNNKIDALDALFVVQYTIDLKPGDYRCPPLGTYPFINLTSADVKIDGQVDIVDALFILQYVVGIRDSLETLNLVAPYTDADNDLITDQEESLHSCMDPLVYDSESDPDNDGLNNIAEVVLGTEPCKLEISFKESTLFKK